MAPRKKKEIFRKINLDLINRPEDIARMEIHEGELQELAESIKERGLLQPIEVTPRDKGYLIVFGDRRYLAHKLLGRKDIMCRIEEMEDEQVVVDRAMENVQRVNLTPFEEGHIYKGLYEKAGMKLDEISRRVGKSPGVVKRMMDILRMPESFQKALHARSISITVAEELWSTPDAAKREYFLEMAVDHGITKSVARGWVDDFKKSLRSVGTAGNVGGGESSVYENAPIFRACDVCKGPVEFKDLHELRVCESCHGGILEVLKKGN